MSNVIWITGLSAAGKTTLGLLLVEHLRSAGKPAVLLDGDELRAVFGVSAGYSEPERLDLAFKYSRLAKLIACQGVLAVVSTVALFKSVHRWNRDNLPGYFEVYLKVSLEELRRRDPKGLYRRYALGEERNVAGMDLKFDEPERPELIMEYVEGLNPEMQLEKLLETFNNFCKTN